MDTEVPEKKKRVPKVAKVIRIYTNDLSLNACIDLLCNTQGAIQALRPVVSSGMAAEL